MNAFGLIDDFKSSTGGQMHKWRHNKQFLLVQFLRQVEALLPGVSIY